MTRIGSAGSTVPSEWYPSGSLGLSKESMTRVGSLRGVHGSTVLGLASFGMLTMFFVVLRLVLCRLGVDSGVLLRGNSSSGMISLLRPRELDILFEMLVGKYNTADNVKNQNGISLISILWHYHDDGVHRELSECRWCLVNRCERH